MNRYPNYDDLSRLEYGRLFWKNPDLRQILLEHWTDPRHPYRDRFLERREIIERVLSADEGDEEAIEADLTAQGLSLRTVIREIPPVFGSFWRSIRR